MLQALAARFFEAALSCEWLLLQCLADEAVAPPWFCTYGAV